MQPLQLNIMRSTIILLVLTVITNIAFGQTRKTYRINSIKEDSGALMSSAYRYPQFEKGVVSFKNQPLASADLNYNYLSGQILFATPNGQELELAKPETLDYIAIGKDTFYYIDKEYAEKLTHYPAINLFKKETIKFNGTEKKGAYGTYSATTGASSINTFSDDKTTQRIPVDENTLYATNTQFYLRQSSNNFVPVNKKNFYKIFSKEESKLSDYLKNNSIHYNKEEDVLKLLKYLQEQ